MYIFHFHLIFTFPSPSLSFPALFLLEEEFFLVFTLLSLKCLSNTASHCYVYVAQNLKKYNMKDSKKSPSCPELPGTIHPQRQAIPLVSRSLPIMHKQMTELPVVSPETGSLWKPRMNRLNFSSAPICVALVASFSSSEYSLCTLMLTLKWEVGSLFLL